MVDGHGEVVVISIINGLDRVGEFTLAKHLEWIGSEFIGVVNDVWIEHHLDILWLFLELDLKNIEGWVDIFGESFNIDRGGGLGRPSAGDAEHEELNLFAVRVELELLGDSIWDLVDSFELLKFQVQSCWNDRAKVVPDAHIVHGAD